MSSAKSRHEKQKRAYTLSSFLVVGEEPRFEAERMSSFIRCQLVDMVISAIPLLQTKSTRRLCHTKRPRLGQVQAGFTTPSMRRRVEVLRKAGGRA